MSDRLADELFDRLGCRALVVLARSSRDPFLAPFTGPARLGESFMVLARGRAPRLGYLTPMDRREARSSGLEVLTPEELDVERWSRDGAAPHELLAHVLSRALQLCELAPGRLALAGCVEAGRLQAACGILAAEGWSFVPGEPAVRRLRKRKSEAHLAALRRVAAGTGAALRAAAERLAGASIRDAGPRGGELWLEGGPLTVARLRRAVDRVLRDRGLEQPEGGILAPAGEGAVPHSSGAPGRVLRAGESLVIDLFPCGATEPGTAALFCDCSRTLCVGAPPPPLRSAHARVLEALELARAGARPGVRGWALQEEVCEHFRRAGYPTPISDRGTRRGYVHGLGHGVGFELHETPSFREHAPDDEGVLEPGDVFALEPGLYEPEAGWAVRLEDLHVLGADGIENLTPLPYDLDPRAW